MRSKILIVIIFLFLSNLLFANPAHKTLALDFQNITVQDALHILAKFLHQNIVVNSDITGTVTLHLHAMSNEEAFALLLKSHDLVKHKMGNTWFITHRKTWIAEQQENATLQNAFEESMPLITRLWQIHYAKVEDIARLIQDSNQSLLSKRGHVRVDARTNTLCIQDTVSHLFELQRVINRLDIPVQQILIEARLATIDNDYERALGVDFAVNCLSSGKEEKSAFPIPKRFSLAVATLANGSELDVRLAALEEAGHAELISSPRLFTANQQAAAIESGEEIPYQEISSSGGTGVAFKKAVLSLKVVPQVMPGNQVLLQLQVNQDRPSTRMILGVPAISTRQISTNVLVKNGQTIVVGGIYEANQEHAVERIPFLGKIPLVGWLFTQQNVIERKRELLIFVTPKIIFENNRVC